MGGEFQRMINDQKASINQNPNKMAVQIIEVGDAYTVNGKTVFENTDGLWESSTELTNNEKEVFMKHLNAQVTSRAIDIEVN